MTTENLKEVVCLITDALFEEEIPTDGDSYDMGISVTYEIVDSPDPEDIGLSFRSVLYANEFCDVVACPRRLISGEMTKIVRKLRNHTERVTMFLDPEDELVTPEMLKITSWEDVDESRPSSKVVTVNIGARSEIPENNPDTSKFRFRNQIDLPTGSVNLTEITENVNQSRSKPKPRSGTPTNPQRPYSFDSPE